MQPLSAQIALAYAHFEAGRVEDTVSILQACSDPGPVPTALLFTANAIVSERKGDVAAAQEGFEKALAIGVPLPGVLRECARYFKRMQRFEQAYYCYAILQHMVPNAIDEFLDRLPQERWQYLPLVVHRLLRDSRPHYYTFRPFKDALVEHLGADGAAVVLAEMIAQRSEWKLLRLPLTSLHEFARAQGLAYEELWGIAPILMQGANVHGEGVSEAVTATTRAFFFVKIRDVVVSGTSNIILANGNALLDFQGAELDRIPLNFSVDPLVLDAVGGTLSILVRSATQHFGKALSLLGVHSGVFGHWMIEFLPKLWACMRPGFENVPVLIDEQMPPQHREALELLIGPNHQIVVVKQHEAVHVGELWCASMPVYIPTGPKPGGEYERGLWAMKPDAFVALLHNAQRNITINTSGAPSQRRIYLTRKPSQKRKLINREAVEIWFKNNGFEIVDFGEKSFADQIRYVKGAEIVVGPDGSAFYMTLFARVGARIGLLTHQFLDDFEWYPQLCRELGQHHCVLKGEIAREDASYRQFADYRIDINLLPAFLDELMATA
jgi:capsular polysaccharide biosynthesis protein